MARQRPGDFASHALVLRDAALFTDLYELTMAATYLQCGMHEPATFSLFVRRLPPGRSFLVASGLEDVLAYLASFSFSRDAVRYLASLGIFDRELLRYLRTVRFTGDVYAVPEGTVLFADEPLLEVTAPIIEAQLVETAILNFCHVQTLLASKAARSVLAARGKPVVEFGLRRAPGIDAGMKAARAAFIAGSPMSSNVLAGSVYGIPPTGTMAHSFVTAFRNELDAFRAFAAAFPRNTVLLLDTYDTIAAARKAVLVAQEMAARGERLSWVRLDSGDLDALSRQVRAILDAAGLHDVRIFASGGLDEETIDRLMESGAPIDAFGVGTKMDVSADAPYLDMAYKLVHYAGRDVLKLSPDKETWTGAKQVYRRRGADGRFAGDVIALRDEAPLADWGEPLLQRVMECGRRVVPAPSLAAIQAHCRAQLERLPDGVKRLRGAEAYPVELSAGLQARQRGLEARAVEEEVGPWAEEGA